MTEVPKAFPPLICQMVYAGERAGSMPDMLRRMVETLETEALLRSKLRSAMIYPCIMLVLTTAVVVFLLTAIVPKLQTLFRSKQSALPLPTQWLKALGDISSNYGLWILLGVGLLLAALILFLRTREGARLKDAFLLKTPLVGSIYRTSVLARSARTLGLLVQS